MKRTLLLLLAACLILLANSEGLWWGKPLDKAEVQKSRFTAAFLEHFRP